MSVVFSTMSTAATQPQTGIQFVGGYVYSPVGGSNSSVGNEIIVDRLSGGIDTKPQYNDLVVTAFGIGEGVNRGLYIEGGRGATTLNSTWANDTYDLIFSIGYTFYDGSKITAYSDGSGSGSSSYGMALGAMVFRNVDPVTPMDVTPNISGGANSPNPNPTQITPVTNGALGVGIGLCATNQTADIFRQPTGMTDFFTVGTESGSGWKVTIGMGVQPESGGLIDPGSFTFLGSVTATYVPYGRGTLALRPKYPS